MKTILYGSVGLLICSVFLGCTHSTQSWVVDGDTDWAAGTEQRGVKLDDGLLIPTASTGVYASNIKRYETKRQAKSLTIAQSPLWQNWEPIPHLGPLNLWDAPVLLAKGPNDYWIFGRHHPTYRANNTDDPENFKPEPAELDGFEVPLLTTPWVNQYNAPGGLNAYLGGYNAWHSRDMVNWVHHGPVTPRFAKWVTSAEYADGKTYIFYDFPNDQDPHVFEDDDLFDGKPGNNLGLAFKDPSHGSDSAFIRDLNGNFHVIFEDWSPLNAKQRSWDSPLAGHAVSPTPAGGYTTLDPAVDHRTTPTGRFGTYQHPHWNTEDPDNYPTNEGQFEIHEPEQPAYGDWAAIAIGGQYYLFGDYDPVGGHEMSVGWFTSDDINKPFQWCGHIGKGHPDPDIAFAEGRFYLITQNDDFVSPGPWVETVEARLGVDTNNDGQIDTWTNWQQVKETYDYIEGFAKQISRTPAKLDASGLPAGYGFQFELKLTDSTTNKAKPMIDRVIVDF